MAQNKNADELLRELLKKTISKLHELQNSKKVFDFKRTGVGQGRVTYSVVCRKGDVPLCFTVQIGKPKSRVEVVVDEPSRFVITTSSDNWMILSIVIDRKIDEVYY